MKQKMRKSRRRYSKYAVRAVFVSGRKSDRSKVVLRFATRGYWIICVQTRILVPPTQFHSQLHEGNVVHLESEERISHLL